MNGERLFETHQIQGEKVYRTRIRLKHSLAAGEEINTVLPDSLAEFEAALARGGVEELRVLVTALDERSGGTPPKRPLGDR